MSNPIEQQENKKTKENALPDCEQNANRAAAKRHGRRGIRFGLPELLLLTTAIAGWLPVVVAHRQMPNLENQIQTMHAASMELMILDDQQLSVRKLPSIWHNISGWKYNAPPGADLELRFATEGINSLALPTDYEAVGLPEGTHTIHLKTTHDAEGHHHWVYIDDESVLQQHHPPDWLASDGSSSTGDVTINKSASHPLDQPLNLIVRRHRIKLPLEKYVTISIPSDRDQKGNFLWISPKSIDSPPANFLLPPSDSSWGAIGNRQGIRVRCSRNNGLSGLIDIQPSLNATLEDQWQFYNSRCAVSVRPVLEDSSKPEIPEEQGNALGPTDPGVSISLHDTIDPLTNVTGNSMNKVTTKAISADGKSLRVFAHYQSFASGAQPIVEILFDANHPDRVGFLPHAAPNSVPMKACQFVTRFDARFFWRKIQMFPNGKNDSAATVALPTAVPLSKLYTQSDLTNDSTASDAKTDDFPWKNIPLASLPLVQETDDSSEMFRISLITDVTDSSKLVFPPSLSQRWQYNGMANRQVWWLPTAATDDTPDAGVTVDVRASSVFPTTKIPLPGGPAIGSVRVTVPMPATQPVWLEIIAEPLPTQ